MPKFSHLDNAGRARMVDIGSKEITRRTARAEGTVTVSQETLRLLHAEGLPKGNPFEVARIAGIQAAKRTGRLIPLCHDIQLDHVNVEIETDSSGFKIRCSVSCRWATGVEMEALTGVSVAALTLYDMCKAVDGSMTIGNIRLIEKLKEPLED